MLGLGVEYKLSLLGRGQNISHPYYGVIRRTWAESTTHTKNHLDNYASILLTNDVHRKTIIEKIIIYVAHKKINNYEA